IIFFYGLDISNISRADIKQIEGYGALFSIYLFYLIAPAFYFLGFFFSAKRRLLWFIFVLIFIAGVVSLLFMTLRVRTFIIAPLFAFVMGVLHRYVAMYSIKKRKVHLWPSKKVISFFLIIL